MRERERERERETDICNWFNGVCDSHSKLIENAKINPEYQNLEKKFGFSARRVIEARHWLFFFLVDVIILVVRVNVPIDRHISANPRGNYKIF